MSDPTIQSVKKRNKRRKKKNASGKVEEATESVIVVDKSPKVASSEGDCTSMVVSIYASVLVCVIIYLSSSYRYTMSYIAIMYKSMTSLCSSNHLTRLRES